MYQDIFLQFAMFRTTKLLTGLPSAAFAAGCITYLVTPMEVTTPKAKVTPEDNPELELVQVQLITRHGLRTPQRYHFIRNLLSHSEGRMPKDYKDFPWRCVERTDPHLNVAKESVIIPFEQYKLNFGCEEFKLLLTFRKLDISTSFWRNLRPGTADSSWGHSS
jgi:hypothetical protein